MGKLPRKDWKAFQIPWQKINDRGEGKRCYQLSERTVAMLLSQTGYLHWPTRWSRETPFTAEELDQIEAWASQAETELMKDSDCVECDDDDCITYPLNGARMEWIPADPFTEPDLVPPGYLNAPWYIAAPGNLAGAAPGDVVTDLLHLPIGMALPPYDRITRFRLTVTGAVRVQIYFVNLFQGGLAQVQIDGELGSLSYFDLNADIVSIPPEPAGEVIWEHEFTTAGEHFIDVAMFPWFDDSTSAVIRYGGGVRRILICGDNIANCDDCPEPEPCEDCEDCQDYIEDEFDLDEDEIHMLLDCYKHDVGDIKMNAGVNVGGSWLLCDGTMHAKDQYPDLYAVLEGKTSETETEFSVPDFSLKSPMGVGEGLDALAAAGESTHTLTVEEMPEHDHSVDAHTHSIPSHTHSTPNHQHSIPDHAHTTPALTHVVELIANHNIVVPAKDNSAAGSTDRVMSSSGAGSNKNLTIDTLTGYTANIQDHAAGVTNNAVLSTNSSGGSVTGSGGSGTSGSGGGGTSGAAGGGEAHSILHPVMGVYFYIFAGCAISESDCA